VCRGSSGAPGAEAWGTMTTFPVSADRTVYTDAAVFIGGES
jgi:hypothetical protein